MVPKPIQHYLDRHCEPVPEARAMAPPAESLRLCVVIPALTERDGIHKVLDSLQAGSQRTLDAEVIVVVNNSGAAPSEVVEENRATIRDLQGYTGSVPLVVLDRASPACALSPKVAGVGAARRVGMDLALGRLVAAGSVSRSAIACLDADSPVAPGYIDALLEVFDTDAPPLAGICSCRHPLPAEEASARAIAAYELWLRYVELGVRLAQSPYAFQTIGSCLVASCLGYAQADGMPRRQAGEDFYFLQKMVKAGSARRIVRIPTARVHPSPRVSERVPFGTGRAMLRCREEGLDRYLFVEPPQAYRDLGRFFLGAPQGFAQPEGMRPYCSPQLATFLEGMNGWQILLRLRLNAHGPGHFVKAIHDWFDSLQVVRYARACQAAWGGVGIFEALVEVARDLSEDALAADLDALAPEPELPQLLLWLERLREGENACAAACAEGMNSS